MVTDKAPERLWRINGRNGQISYPDSLPTLPSDETTNYVRDDIYEAVVADRDALREALPDEIDLYRLLKKHGARSYADAAKVIATHLAVLQEEN